MDCKLRAKNCGGCPLLGLDYAAQLKQKEEKVRALLGKYGPVHPIRGMEQPYHYRNKVISTFATGWGGKLTSGIYAANSHKVLPVESCLLQDEVLDKTMLAVRAAAGICHYQPFNEDKDTGLLRHCLLRRGVMTGQVMVVLVTAQPVLPGARNFVKALLGQEVNKDISDAFVDGSGQFLFAAEDDVCFPEIGGIAVTVAFITAGQAATDIPGVAGTADGTVHNMEGIGDGIQDHAGPAVNAGPLADRPGDTRGFTLDATAVAAALGIADGLDSFR